MNNILKNLNNFLLKNRLSRIGRFNLPLSDLKY